MRLLQLAPEREIPAVGARPGGLGAPEGPVRVLRGRRLREDVWRFDDVPAGTWLARVSDGISWSEAEEIVVEPERTGVLRTTWTGPTGIAIRVRDEEGHRVLGALIHVEGREGILLGGPQAGLSVSLSFFATPDVSVPSGPEPGTVGTGWLEVPPGRYEVVVRHPGFDDAHATVEVVAGRIARLESVLRRAGR